MQNPLKFFYWEVLPRWFPICMPVLRVSRASLSLKDGMCMSDMINCGCIYESILQVLSQFTC